MGCPSLKLEKDGWSVVYKRAYNPDGSLFFPQKLTQQFLDNAKKTMGSYLFANQYLNQVIPDEDRVFKKEWFKYYETLPDVKYTFAFIDPAISLEDTADYTAVIVVDVDPNNYWYVRAANRYRVIPTQIINLIFEIQDKFKPMCIGVEDVAYQKALLYMVHQETQRRNKVVPIKGIKPDNDKSKELRIQGLQPRFEWNRIFLNRGLNDLELELLQFPRSQHDDLIDALAYIESIAVVPQQKEFDNNEPHDKSGPDWERWYIRNIARIKASQENSD